MGFAFVLLGVVAIVYVFIRGLRGTVFELSIERQNFGGLLIGKEIFAYVVMGVILFELLGFKSFHTFFVTEESMHEATWYTLYAVFMFLASISFLSKKVFGKYLRVPLESDTCEQFPGKEKLLLKISSFALIVVLLVMYGFGMQNAFLRSIIEGKNLMTVRLANTYGTELPSVVTSYYTFLIIFLSICTGICYSRLSGVAKAFYLLLILYAASFQGGKEPVVNAFVVVLLANLSQRKRVTMGKTVWLALAGIPLLLVAFYFVSLVQFPDLTVEGYLQFLASRLGVGQIQGVYEQFGLQWRRPDYILQAIPFSNFFVSSAHYNKDLMMATWGSGLDLDSTGVMNSFFIGEALAIGGYGLVLLSPLIVAINYCTISVSLLAMLRRFVGIPLERGRKYVILLTPGLVRLTGDLDGVVLFKLNVMLVLFLATIAVVFQALRKRNY